VNSQKGGVGVNLHAVVHIRYRVVEVPEVRAGLLSRYTSSAGFDWLHWQFIDYGLTMD
jgi:hypothetical protein